MGKEGWLRAQEYQIINSKVIFPAGISIISVLKINTPKIAIKM